MPTSASVARSVTTSTAGGSEVSDAAAKKTMRPSPSSTSTNRRRRTREAPAEAASLRTAKKFMAPRMESPPRITTLVSTMSP